MNYESINQCKLNIDKIKIIKLKVNQKEKNVKYVTRKLHLKDSYGIIQKIFANIIIRDINIALKQCRNWIIIEASF